MNPPQSNDVPPSTPKRVSLLFQLTAAAAVLFIITVLAMVATVFGDPTAPAAKQLNQNAGKLIAIEVGAIMLLGFAAMTQDRRQTLRERKDDPGSGTAKFKNGGTER